MKTVFVGYLIFALTAAHALVPVEGIIMGRAQENLQMDPLLSVFSDIYDKSQFGENKKVKLYHATYASGINLNESCTYLSAPTYSSPWDEKQAKRSVVSTLQYIGLDTTIKAVGAYAKVLEVGQEDYKKLVSNLVTQYCSKNMTLFSLKNIERSLEFYYEKPVMSILPSVESSPFATDIVKNVLSKPATRSREFDLAIRNFRAFCSWGGEVEDYRMLTSYLNNKFIMAFVIKNLSGLQDQIDGRMEKVVTRPALKDTVQVACTDLICRKESFENFKKKFPLSAGSTGHTTDLSKMYCSHFRFQDSPQTKVPQVKEWIKANELEDPILETSNFISLMTGVPDLFNAVDAYIDIPMLVRSSIDEKWNRWSKQMLGLFSTDLLYEESLRVQVEPRKNVSGFTEGFIVDFTITLGELDRLNGNDDKLKVTFDLKFSKNYLRSIRLKSAQLEKEIDDAGKKRHKEEIARYVGRLVKEKEKLFMQKMWNDDFGRLIGEELLSQLIAYKGPLFESYSDEMITVPVRFSYGLFALSYLHYRSDVAAGRLKLNL